MDDTPLLSEDIEYDESTDVYRFRYDWTDDESLATAIAIAVAAVADTDPLELDPLRSVVDPDALDDLFAPTAGGYDREASEVSFTLADHGVVVSGTGEVEIDPP